MRGVRTFIATISILTVGIASADEIKTMSAFDYLVGFDEFIGKTVEINDCVAYGVNTDFFLCSVETETGNAGTINIRLKDTPKKQLIYGLKKCASIMGTEADICTATIVGEADKTIDGGARLNAKEITWHSKK